MADTEKENTEVKAEDTGSCEAQEAGADEAQGKEAEEPCEMPDENTQEASAEADEDDAGASGDEDDSGQSSQEASKKERKLNWTKMGKGSSKESKEDVLNARLAEEKDRYTRLMAEFDNFRKRNEKEKDAMYDFGARVVIEKILPVIDNFERGLNALSDEEKESGFAQGMDKTYRQFMEILEGMGVKPIEAVGAQFNPELHNAVMHVDDESVGENIVVEEFQKGYTYKDKLVRASMVKVAN